MEDLKNYTLLYAEDEMIIRMSISKYLENYLKKIYTATNGKEALKKYYEKKPDIVLLDINMPYLGGLEVAREIRKENEQIPIVIITAYTDTQLLLEAVELNLTKYILKPVVNEKLDEMMDLVSKKLKSKNIVYLKGGYYFDTKALLLFNNKREEIHLTKNERKLVSLLINSKGQFVSSEIIEYHIWGDLAIEIDCKSRLKSLLNGLRKKLPKDIIQNNYSLGYRLM